jgi:hypothetical protein
MPMRFLLCLAAALSASAPVRAVEVKFEGYVDVRLVAPSDKDRTWLDGGLSKLRFDGAGERDDVLGAVEAVLEGSVQLAPALMAFGSLRYDDDQRSPVDLIEAYVRFRPVSTSAWRWSAKLGAFFPPISLENNEIGWTSFWTLTPSAINTWVGEEIRTIGAEGKLERRGAVDTFELDAALFAWNDPAGILIADRGWALGDRPTALFDHPRLPDAFAISRGEPVPSYTAMFKEIDDEPGWYGALSWRREGVGRAGFLFYDNRADPSAVRGQIAWRTEFSSLGLETEIAGIALVAQAMTGETEIAPSLSSIALTRFSSAFVLAGWEWEEWRLAGRADIFATDHIRRKLVGMNWVESEGRNREHGHAFTIAATWVPEPWLRLTAEALFVHSYRPLREVVDLDARADEAQIQLAARLYF